VNAIVFLTQGIDNNMGHRVPCGFCNGMSQPMSFRVFNIEAYGSTFYTCRLPLFLP
jgi:hypothetical protein